MLFDFMIDDIAGMPALRACLIASRACLHSLLALHDWLIVYCVLALLACHLAWRDDGCLRCVTVLTALRACLPSVIACLLACLACLIAH